VAHARDVLPSALKYLTCAEREFHRGDLAKSAMHVALTGLAFRRSEAARWPGFAPAFMPAGPPEVGSLFRQAGVARTLQTIAADGPRKLL
jgi:gamma-glutamyltranspeptidase